MRVGVFGQGEPGQALVAGLEEAGHHASLFASLDAPPEGMDALVWAWAEPLGGKPQRLADMSPEHWAATAEAPLTLMLQFLKLAHATLATRGGRVIVLLPALAMSGAAGLVPWGTAAEGQRSIVKAVARKWGPLGITANSVAVPAELLVPTEDGQVLERPGMPPTILARPAMRETIAPLVASLLTPAWTSVTGTTIGADGGRWMTP